MEKISSREDRETTTTKTCAFYITEQSKYASQWTYLSSCAFSLSLLEVTSWGERLSHCSLASGTPPLLIKGLLAVHTWQEAASREAAAVVAPAGVIFTRSRSKMELSRHGAMTLGFFNCGFFRTFYLQ